MQWLHSELGCYPFSVVSTEELTFQTTNLIKSLHQHWLPLYPGESTVSPVQHLCNCLADAGKSDWSKLEWITAPRPVNTSNLDVYYQNLNVECIQTMSSLENSFNTLSVFKLSNTWMPPFFILFLREHTVQYNNNDTMFMALYCITIKGHTVGLT